MDKKAAATEVSRLRKQAGDKTIPQAARNKMLDQANKIEQMYFEKEAGYAKGGAVKAKKPAAKKATTRQSPVVAVMIGMTDKKKQSKMACGGSVKKGK